MSGKSHHRRSAPGLRELLLKLVVVAAATTPLIAVGWIFRAELETLLLDRLILYGATRLSAEDRAEYLRLLAAEMPGLFEAVPEPTVGRTLLPGTSKPFRGVEIAANNAGMRDAGDYVPKAPGVLRVVCLGDSATFGVGGPEEDRWCDQLEASLRERLQQPATAVEAYALAVPSWSAVNEATYLTSRISDYRPDLVLGLLVSNDIDLTAGVTGTGIQTSAFSPERRGAGSGVPSLFLPLRFGVGRLNLLASGLGEESRRLWRTAFDAWRRLEDVLAATGGRLLLGVIAGQDPLFDELVKYHHAASGLRSPLILTSPRGHRLAHDPHPDRQGHAVIAGHYLRALSTLGWVDLGPAGAPEAAPGLDLDTAHAPRPEEILALQEQAARRLPEALDFDRLTEDAIPGLLGGVTPAARDDPLRGGVWGSTETLFLLRRRASSRTVTVTIEVPAREELFPFRLELRTQGRPPAVLDLAASGEAGRHELEGELAESGEPVIEIALTTRSYWCEIADPTMKSYRLLSAVQD